jgi:hypothetical protein
MNHMSHFGAKDDNWLAAPGFTPLECRYVSDIILVAEEPVEK